MKLTLYKKCILNNSYTEVFNVKKMTEKDGQQMSVLDAYLAGLDKFEYENEFIYTEQTGSFQIELYPLQNADDIYSFNYLKVEEMDDSGKVVFKRYCFIDNITKIASDVVSVFYSEDVWSSYSGTMEIRDGIISNKLKNPRVPYYLPIPYDGNNEPLFAPWGNKTGFIIVCQLQVYDLNEDGVPNKRKTYTTCVAETAEEVTDNTKKLQPSMFTEAEVLNAIVYTSSEEKFKQWDSKWYDTATHYYEVDNFTLIPVNSGDVNNWYEYQNIGLLTIDMADGTKKYLSFLDMTSSTSGLGYEYLDEEINVDFKTLAIGTYAHQYQITPNGSIMRIRILLLPTAYDFKIMLYYQNKRIDITNDFVVKVPFTVLNGEENTSKKIQRELATINGVFDIVQGTAETAIQAAGATVTGGFSLTGGAISEQSTNNRINYSRIDRQITSTSSTSSYNRTNKPTASGLVGSAMKIANGITEVIYANKLKYSSTQGTFATSDGLWNAITGFGALIMQPDNEAFVEELLKRQGYTVFMTAESYDDVFGNVTDYDIIKMLTVILYGNFAQDINYQLTDILTTGVRVFNTDNVQI